MSGQYGAAKAALIFDTERWALEFVPYGIRVNTVSPGSILVEGNGWDRYRLTNPGYYEDYVRHGFPMGRLGSAEEVADVIVFIASPRAHWINGRNIPVDGLEQPHAPLREMADLAHLASVLASRDPDSESLRCSAFGPEAKRCGCFTAKWLCAPSG